MAEKSVILDLQETDPAVSPDSLVFQDIAYSHSVSSADKKEKGGNKKSNENGYEQTHTFTNFPNPDDSEEEVNNSQPLKKDESRTASFWSFKYYQTFFDVDTFQVLQRILHSFIPNPRGNYLQSYIRPNPDLYGPFWICTTLVFCIAVSGNIAKYLQEQGSTINGWHYDFHKVTFAASAIFFYWLLVPCLLYSLLWYKGNSASYTFTELLSIYGYSLSLYIPVSILWAIQLVWLQWTLLIVAASLSASVLVITLWPAVRSLSKQLALVCLSLVVLLHALLATGFLLYFFVPSSPNSILTTTASAFTSSLGTTTPSISTILPAHDSSSGL